GRIAGPLEGVAARGLRELGDALAGPLRMAPRARDDDAVPGATGLDLFAADPRAHRSVTQALTHPDGAALVHPVRDRDGQAGGGRGVGVLVGGDVHARRARALDARCGVPDLSPVLLPGRFVVRELHAHLRAPADLDVLFDRIEELRALVADVAGVEPALRAHHLAERGQLVGRAERAWRVA